MTQLLPHVEGLTPLGLLAMGAVVVVLVDAVFTRGGAAAREHDVGSGKGLLLGALTGSFLLFSMVSAALNAARLERRIATAGDMLVVDATSSFAVALLCGGALLTLSIAVARPPPGQVRDGEFYPLLLFAVTGAGGVVYAGNLVSLAVAIELTSLPLCILAAFDRERAHSVDAGTLLLLTGGFASAISLYGVALVYGATGHLDYVAIRGALADDLPLAQVGLALLLVGMLARIAAVPFHDWMSQVNEGASAIFAAVLSTTLMVSAGFALLRMLDTLIPPDAIGFEQVLSVVAVSSMLWGSGMAIVQTNVKGIFAYGSVTHMGFFVVGLVALNGEGAGPALIVLGTFLLMQLGAYGALSLSSVAGMEASRLPQYAGLAERRPILAAALSLFALGLAGLPGTAGFISRFMLMSAAIETDSMILVLTIGLASVLLFAAYLRIPTVMYMSRGRAGTAPATPLPALMALLVCAFATLYLGIYPGEGPLPVDMLQIASRVIDP